MAEQTQQEHLHVEAFCLMEYASDDGKEVEFIWNSRDGVTPFVVRSRLGTEMTHKNWQHDRRIPDFRPQPGSRIFMDLTPERARYYAERRVKQLWGDHSIGMRIGSKEEAIEAAITDWMRQPGMPDVVVVEASEGTGAKVQ